MALEGGSMFIQIDTTTMTLDRVRDILTIARAQPSTPSDMAQSCPDVRTSLAGCATIIMTMALEQGISNRLALQSAYWKYCNRDPLLDPFAAVMGRSIHVRMKHLPELLSDGAYKIDQNAAQYLALCNMITLRNWLVHYSDKINVAPLTAHNPGANDGLFSAGIRLPSLPWATITIEKAEGAFAAVELYFSEIANAGDAANPGLAPGTLVRARRALQ